MLLKKLSRELNPDGIIILFEGVIPLGRKSSVKATDNGSVLKFRHINCRMAISMVLEKVI